MSLFSKNKKKSSNRFMKKTLIVSGLMLGLFMAAPVGNSNSVISNPFTIEAQAAELPYSHRWETQADSQWKYKLDNGSYATSAWVQDEVDGQWYLLGDTGIMRAGIFESYGKYYLLSEVHDGHFGHLVKNGDVYNGITIKADTSKEYEGALSQETINALMGAGYDFGNVSSVTGTQHVSNGQVTMGGTTVNSGSQNTSSNTQTSTNNSNSTGGFKPGLPSGAGGYDPNAKITTGSGEHNSAIDNNFINNR